MTLSSEHLVQQLASEEPRATVLAHALHQQGRSSDDILRALLTRRPPRSMAKSLATALDEWLRARPQAVVDVESLPRLATRPGNTELVLWQGDITTLRVDAITNACNNALLGCFQPFHACIDNAIHWAAGPRLRADCATLMEQQGHPEPTGRCKVTTGYHLPARAVLHTVGPIIRGTPTTGDQEALRSCYRAVLSAASNHHHQTVALCGISTGVFGYPPDKAARVALDTVVTWLERHPKHLHTVVFNVFTDADHAIYHALFTQRGWLP